MRRERDLSYGSNYYGVFLSRMCGGKETYHTVVIIMVYSCVVYAEGKRLIIR